MTQRLVVAAVIVDDLVRPTRALAAQRSRPAALAGRWELPGGKVEPGETPEAALHRELDEELGVVVRLGAELVRDGPGATWPLTAGLVMRTWWCVVETGVPHVGEAHRALRWAGPAELSTLDWLSPDRPVVERIRQRLAADPGAACPERST